MGGPQKSSFANKIRTAIHELTAAGTECSTTNISHQAFIQKPEDHKRMLGVLCDFRKAGELERVSLGVYALTNRKKPEEKRQVMWRVLRMRRLVTIDDLVEMAGVHRDYAGEWLRTLEKQGVVRIGTNGAARLIKDSLEMPEVTDNAEKLRALREKKKKALSAALNSIEIGMDKARAALKDL